jgi:hypothetical protein
VQLAPADIDQLARRLEPSVVKLGEVLKGPSATEQGKGSDSGPDRCSP